MTLPSVALLGLLFAQEPLSQIREGGPLTLAIAYRCPPAERVALRRIMQTGGVARFESWKQEGLLADYHILFNNYLDFETYDMVSVLTFKDSAGVAKWKQIEEVRPGGLPAEALKLVTAAITYSLDQVRHGASEEPPTRGKSVFFIIPYDYVIPADDYVTYVDSYVIPQVNGWIDEKVLAGYTIYLSRYSTERQWGSLFLLEYRDNEAFAKREATVAKVREKLKSNPAWLAASQGKQKIRVEKQTIIAEELIAK